jgi:hypothetical protein
LDFFQVWNYLVPTEARFPIEIVKQKMYFRFCLPCPNRHRIWSSSKKTSVNSKYTKESTMLCTCL